MDRRRSLGCVEISIHKVEPLLELIELCGFIPSPGVINFQSTLNHGYLVGLPVDSFQPTRNIGHDSSRMNASISEDVNVVILSKESLPLTPRIWSIGEGIPKRSFVTLESSNET